jgi:hypothetical protein
MECVQLRGEGGAASLGGLFLEVLFDILTAAKNKLP